VYLRISIFKAERLKCNACIHCISVKRSAFSVLHFMHYNVVHFIKKKKPFVETRGSNDCLPYESANVSQLYFSCINSVLKNVKFKCLYNVCQCQYRL
jgi:hypothetical protein